MNITRRDFTRLAAAFGAVSFFGIGCTAAEETLKEGMKMPVKVKKDKILVAYYSWSGNTKFAAETISAALGGVKLIEIKAVKPYPSGMNECCDEAEGECKGKKLREIEPTGVNVADYDAVLVGTPNWYGTMAPPVRTFLVNNLEALKGKTVCLFQTHGGGGMQRVGADFSELMSGAKVLPAKAFGGSSIRSNVEALRKFSTDRITAE
ncbi:MAG: NAD(P)H-dependent oxidoreductase [Kiritimatiellae bacterium]|nr:NAD(P)H-dependent oxidoreductase [Kiritimatiellia bacterium]